ncbi:MAG: Uma2 family endonuclease [Hydrogenophaga sp.]|uniref:Uma2 family endonuclease n=1 Tax=Hydrogenophaga sp. TaxID=1904254 RepID=UPI002718458C|nr:Uma2 family endonuclease [Hydrogenophaga sp.]MDO9569641.1 Uma2 family endonuclease [Hydrogenophaga sp.]
MSLPLPNTPLTAAEYLEWEATQETRSEFINGQVYAMAGGTLAHNAATLATGASLRQHLKGGPCRAFVSDVRVRVQASNSFFYPDVVVACQPTELADPQSMALAEPKVIVEVLSPSTAAFDRGGKFAHYRLLDSLQEYVLIDPDTAQVDVFRRNAANRWELFPSMGASASVELASVELASVGWVGVVADLLE